MTTGCTFDTAESHERYHCVIAEWEAAGRRLPTPLNKPATPTSLVTAAEIIYAFKIACDQQQRPMDGNVKAVLRLLRQLYGSSSSADVGPKKLRLVREAMVRGDLNANPPRKPWTHISVNKQVHRIASIFKWAASQELV